MNPLQQNRYDAIEDSEDDEDYEAEVELPTSAAGDLSSGDQQATATSSNHSQQANNLGSQNNLRNADQTQQFENSGHRLPPPRQVHGRPPPIPTLTRAARRQHLSQSRISFANIQVPALDGSNQRISEEGVNYLINETADQMYKLDQYCTLADRAIAAGMLAERNRALIRPTTNDRCGLVSLCFSKNF